MSFLEGNRLGEIKRGIYKHYSGKLYQVLGVCRHSETLEEMVVYQALYNDYALWVRPKDMFCETITQEGQTMLRFEFKYENLNVPPPLK